MQAKRIISPYPYDSRTGHPRSGSSCSLADLFAKRAEANSPEGAGKNDPLDPTDQKKH